MEEMDQTGYRDVDVGSGRGVDRRMGNGSPAQVELSFPRLTPLRDLSHGITLEWRSSCIHRIA